MASRKKQSSDERFVRVNKDPRFWEMPEREHKVKIDSRFQSMFHDKRFQLKYTVDKRGRPINYSSKEDLKRFYHQSDSELSDAPQEQEKEKKKKKKKKKQKDKTSVSAEDGPRLEETEKEGGVGVAVKTQKSSERPLSAATGGRGVVVYEEGEHEEVEPVVQGDGGTWDSIVSKDDDDDDDEESGEEEEMLDDSDDDDEGSSEGEEMLEDSDDDDDDDEGEESDLEEGSDGESAEDSDSGPDLARGKGNVETSSDEDEDDVEDVLRREEEEIEHNWGELWKDAPRSDDVTRRLAVCNMDWDRLKAKDLLALFNSFKPKGGVVLSVKIYPSEFGQQRMQVEEAQGPMELTSLPEDPDKDTEEERVFREKMRAYQFKRMRYFYGVVECDSPETASRIYEECDGFEYESSCSTVDLRFIPDQVVFDELPKDVATDVDLAAYTPKYFTSTAMATSKVELTWDETDHERVTTLNRKFKKDEIRDMDFQAYLASSSDEEEEKQDEEDQSGDNVAEGPKETNSQKKGSDQIAKYHELLKEIQDKDRRVEDKAMEMEITWVPGLKESAEQLVKKKMEGKVELTPWEEFLDKKKEKKKQKKAKSKQVKADSDLSDDELPSDVDLNDPFFTQELGTSGLVPKTKSKKGKKAKEEEKTPEEEALLEKQRAEMALLMADEDDDKHKHFNYDKIVEQQNLSKQKKKKLQKRKDLLEEDDFEVDVKDPRFQAMFSSHLYNLDPSDPNYKKTKATRSILEEKRRRREQQQCGQEEAVKRRLQEAEQEADPQRSQQEGAKPSMDPGLSMLIKSIKNKTERFQARKKQKTT